MATGLETMNKVLVIASIVLSMQSVHAGTFWEGDDEIDSAQVPVECLHEAMGEEAIERNIEEITANLDAKRATLSPTTRQALIGALIFVGAKFSEIYGSQIGEILAFQLEALAVADLITGAVHWLEDTYFSEDTPVIGASVIRPNRQHHTHPRALLANSTFKRVRESVIAASIVMGALSLVLDSDQLIAAGAVAVWAALGNEIHAWEHMSAKEKPWIARLLQGYIFQSSAEHRIHHVNTDRNYCVMTPWWNWILNRTHFWRGLEHVVEWVTKVAPREDEKKQKMLRKECSPKEAVAQNDELVRQQ